MGDEVAGRHPRSGTAASLRAGVLFDRVARFTRVVELNVLRQVYNLSRTPIVQNAWKRGCRPMLHGIVYDLHVGEASGAPGGRAGQGEGVARGGSEGGLGYSESVDREIS